MLYNKVMANRKQKTVADLKNDNEVNDIDLNSIDTDLPKEKTELSVNPKDKKRKKPMSKKKKIIIIIVILILAIGGSIAIFFLLNKPAEGPSAPEEKTAEAKHYYSILTGEEISDNSLNSKPTYCMQMPNGTDGARPQVGLNRAGVVFEAIAEAGITRFAAVFQNTDDSVLGPIRSLRTYYLDWDVPFDCTVVHAGGSDEAIAEVKNYRDLTESTTYMWRIKNGYVAPNNLFTSSELLAKFNADKGYNSSDVKAFARLHPNEASEKQSANQKAAEPLTEEEKAAAKESGEKTREVKPLVENISVNFGSTPAFNTIYKYDAKTNSYLRSYANGAEHITYTCDKNSGNSAPKSECGEPSQVAPKAVAVMMIDQWLDSDRYHLRAQTIGTGTSYVFQNGEVIKGTWTKDARDKQIIFKDEDGKEISFTPGQLWIAALPNSTGSVKY